MCVDIICPLKYRVSARFQHLYGFDAERQSATVQMSSTSQRTLLYREIFCNDVLVPNSIFVYYYGTV